MTIGLENTGVNADDASPLLVNLFFIDNGIR